MSNSKAMISSPGTYDAGDLDKQEYQALETALLQTARGRNFLTEYLRRNGGDAVCAQTVMVEEGLAAATPTNDTNMIMQAVERLHHAVMDQQGSKGVDHVRMDIMEMSKAIARTRSEITAMRTDGDSDHLSEATGEMDAIVQSTERATNDILQAAEKIQEVAWRLREAGADEPSCEEIDDSATAIYMACSFQDLTGQRTTKVVRVLQYLEARITSMIDIWGISDEDQEALAGDGNGQDEQVSVDKRPDAHLLNGPQQQDVALGQDNIDALLQDETFPSLAIDDLTGVANTPATDNPISEDELDDLFNDAPSGEIIDEEKLKALFS